jgi:hypothetical protein
MTTGSVYSPSHYNGKLKKPKVSFRVKLVAFLAGCVGAKVCWQVWGTYEIDNTTDTWQEAEDYAEPGQDIQLVIE